MDPKEAAKASKAILADYAPSDPAATAAALRLMWLEAAPAQPPELAPEQADLARDLGLGDAGYESAGVPVAVLTSVGKEIGKLGRKDVADYLPLVRLLWDRYGREGRGAASAWMVK